MKKIYLKKNEERRIMSGHSWVFSNEVLQLEGDPENGDIVEVYSAKEKLAGAGFFNKNSLIAVRLFSKEPVGDLYPLFRSRILNAYNYRKEVYPERQSFRLVFSESDFLPGLIIDKYNNTFVLQVNSFGMEKNIDLIVKILKEDLNAENIFTRNDTHFRTLEGLPLEDKFYHGEIQNEVIYDCRISYNINFESGQKTGFFFDQSDNRFFIEKIVKDKKVLDAFCNAGGFGLHALSAGAASADFVDVSSAEVASAKRNYELNGFEQKAEFIESDVFDFLHGISEQQKSYDVVMIDPPSFTKGRKNLPQAKKGYEKLNRLALNVITNGGYLVSSSCSYHLTSDSFLEVIQNAALKTNKELQLIHFNNASLDHPILPAMPESNYLKFAVFRVHNI
jgi:23S rRNA (cytosine1962-C5)-methyltransferase